MTEMSLSVPYSLKEKIIYLLKSLARFIPFLTLILLAWFSQTYFQNQTNYRSRADTVTKNYYIDATTGNDNNDGLTPATAWKTLGKIRSYDSNPKFQPGDSILLKRGEVWREQLKLNNNGSSGITGSPITIDAYGAGAKPIISGGVDLSSPTKWVDQGNNIWKASNLPTEVAQLIFNNDQSSGYMKLSYSDLMSSPKQGDFYYDLSGQFVEIYSTSNPGNYYNHIEGAQRYSTLGGDGTNMIGINRQYLTIRNVQFRYAAGHGLQIGDNSSHITIENCDFAYIGGAHDSVDKQGGGYRDFNGIMPTMSQSYLIIRNNTFHDIWEHVISFQSWDSVQYTWDHIYIYNNLIYHTTKSALELWDAGCSSPMSTINNFYIYNNTVYDLGDSIYVHQFLDTNVPSALKINDLCANMSNIVVKNNLFSQVDTWHIRAKGTDLTNWDIDYNLYFPDGSGMFYLNDTSSYNLSNWKSHAGKDAHSIAADPKLTNPKAADFNLAIGSPAIDAGALISGITESHNGAAPDIGAIESSSTLSTLTTTTSTTNPVVSTTSTTTTTTTKPVIIITTTSTSTLTTTTTRATTTTTTKPIPTLTPRPTATYTPIPPTPTRIPTLGPTATPAPKFVLTYEAEAANYYGPVYRKNHYGFTGTGFVDYQNRFNDFTEWIVNAPTSGAYTLSFRYANGSWWNRPLQVSINGRIVNTGLFFAKTGNWNTWSYSQFVGPLSYGVNTIRLTAVGSSGPNIDHLKISN
jgi:hypothetical protein